MKRIIALYVFFFFAATVSTSLAWGTSEKKVTKSATHKHRDKKEGCCDMKSGGDTKKDDCCKMDSMKESKKESKEESKKDSDKK